VHRKYPSESHAKIHLMIRFIRFDSFGSCYSIHATHADRQTIRVSTDQLCSIQNEYFYQGRFSRASTCPKFGVSHKIFFRETKLHQTMSYRSVRCKRRRGFVSFGAFQSTFDNNNNNLQLIHFVPLNFGNR
jgi:hypothetical protein